MNIPFKFVMGYLLSALGIVFGLIFMATRYFIDYPYTKTPSTLDNIIKYTLMGIFIMICIIGIIVTTTEYNKYKQQKNKHKNNN